ncbi:3-oxo-tetronate kinase [Rhizobium leucaenae]|uniref:3-oxo-tetronate kinase n=1 Tax=Rhizobium leucaenae TaxID=29450 RepID=UPI0003FA47E2|nr:3-oxo-tetronate kinase [Rhizobium leucaenae]
MTVSGKLLVGCVADDFTGATDVANIFARGGLKTIVVIGIPDDDRQIHADAIVVALKTRTIDPKAAIEESLSALRWLRGRGAEKFFFKYCSTFDSTTQGNIGPVTDAMLAELGENFTIACPAFPANARTIYKGNLFVGDVPLNESGMRNHPLTPMTDANLLRVLAPQTKAVVSGCYYDTVKLGAAAIRKWREAADKGAPQIAVVDAISDDDLIEIASGFGRLKLFTGASGLAYGLTRVFDQDQNRCEKPLPLGKGGHRAVISGSCSVATNDQVKTMLADHEGFRIDVASLAEGRDVVGEALDWSSKRLGPKPLLFYATAKPDEVKANQSRLGVAESGDLVEKALSEIARKLVENGVNELIVAGGETSGAVVKSLGVDQLAIGNEITPGVPWVGATSNGRQLSLALKSGNFGGPRFFIDAWDRL